MIGSMAPDGFAVQFRLWPARKSNLRHAAPKVLRQLRRSLLLTPSSGMRLSPPGALLYPRPHWGGPNQTRREVRAPATASISVGALDAKAVTVPAKRPKAA